MTSDNLKENRSNPLKPGKSQLVSMELRRSSNTIAFVHGFACGHLEIEGRDQSSDPEVWLHRIKQILPRVASLIDIHPDRLNR
jgi:hypothetical protein